MLTPLFRAERKRHRGDCAVASLAGLLQVPYEEVLAAAASLAPTVLVRGMYNNELIKVANAFGKLLAEVDQSDIDWQQDVGILGLTLEKETAEGEEHAVILAYGLVYDVSDGTVWRWSDYRRYFKATVIDFLEIV